MIKQQKQHQYQHQIQIQVQPNLVQIIQMIINQKRIKLERKIKDLKKKNKKNQKKEKRFDLLISLYLL